MPTPKESKWDNLPFTCCLILMGLLCVICLYKAFLYQQKMKYLLGKLPQYEVIYECSDGRKAKDIANLIIDDRTYAVGMEDKLVEYEVPSNCKITQTYQIGKLINANTI